MKSTVLFIAALLITGCASQAPSPPLPPPEPTAETVVVTPAALTLGERAKQHALTMVGTPYRYGGATPDGFDCSGLVYWAYGRSGVRLPRTSTQLRRALPAVDSRRLQIGDLLFFDTSNKSGHVGIYVGDRKFVHAPSSGGRVEVVELDRGYYANRLLQVGRPR